MCGSMLQSKTRNLCMVQVYEMGASIIHEQNKYFRQGPYCLLNRS